MKTEDIYKDFGKDVGKRFGVSNFKLGKTLPKMKKKVIGLIKEKLSGKLMKKICWIKSKKL